MLKLKCNLALFSVITVDLYMQSIIVGDSAASKIAEKVSGKCVIQSVVGQTVGPWRVGEFFQRKTKTAIKGYSSFLLGELSKACHIN
jgi:hypothetical protein